MTQDKKYSPAPFRVDEKILQRLTAEGLNGGGDYCDLFFENTTFSDLLLRDGQVASGGFHTDCGVGIRVLDGERTGYAYSESTDLPSMLEAARAASAIASGGKAASPEGSPVRLRVQEKPADRYPAANDWREVPAGRLVPVLERLEAMIRAKDSRIIKVIAMISSQTSDILMYNSLGELTGDSRPLASLSVSVIFSEKGKVENRSVSRSFRMGAEMLGDVLLGELAADAVKGMDEQFAARRPKGGRMPVVMGAGASGILLHEAMGHAFEADFNRKGQSIFADKMGRKVCRDGISIVDDGTLPGNRGAVNFDDEGIPGQKT